MDGVPVPHVSIEELSNTAFEIFRNRASRSGRVGEDMLRNTNQTLLENLYLTDGEYLKRATILLFHPDPERYISGAYIKLGRFLTDDDLYDHDEVHGSLLEQIEKASELLKSKYLKTQISYEGMSRIEETTFPELAIREALLNAIAHKDYSSAVPVQIRVYGNKIIFWNGGQLPDNWTVEHLTRQHPSKPFNPDVANTLFRAGYIESWGRGTIKMITECHKHNLPAPRYYFDFAGFVVEFFKITRAYLEAQGLNEELASIILYVQEKGSISNSEVQSLLKVSKPTASRYLHDLDGRFLEKVGSTGKGTSYKLKVL
jgi:ATP-dependent DNA helicase RecG